MKPIKFFLSLIAAVVFAVAPVANAEEIVIFHTNDMHSRVMSTDDGGRTIGLAAFAAYIKHAKTLNPNALWFDSGDTFHGMPLINISRGDNMVKLLNAAGLDAFVPGNHDFNYGAERLVELSKRCKFPFLAANIFWGTNGERLFPAYKIFKLKNGVKLGVFGLTTPETKIKANPLFVGKLNFHDTIKTAQDMIKVLKPQCDIIIVVMHMGLDKSSIITSEEIASSAPGIDVIIDGHSHTELPTGLTVGNTLIAQTGCYGHNLGKVTIDYEDKRVVLKKAELLNKTAIGKVVDLSDKDKDKKANAKPSENSAKLIKPDEKVLAVLKAIETDNTAILSQKICEFPKTLTAEREIIRREEAEIGDLLTDSFVWYTGADAAIINSGTIRTDLKAGVVTRGSILAIFPFGNILEVRKITGRDLRLALEHSVAYYPSTFGGFLQVSGIMFDFDPALPAGKRVSNILVKGSPLDENASYSIASADFVFNGGDGYDMLKNAKLEKAYGALDEVFVKYIQEHKNYNIKTGRINRLER